MYPHFIEVHDGDQTMIVNIDKIGIVKDKLIMVEHPTRWQPVDESYDEIKKLIMDSGCIINKEDPRLDNKPLTGFDFMGMKEGEPIWSPNRQEWYLFSSYDPVHMEGKVKDVNGNTGIFNRDTLIKYPLYRMKVEG